MSIQVDFNNVIQVMPSSPAINALYEILRTVRTGNHVTRLKKRKEKISHGQTQYIFKPSEAKGYEDYGTYTSANSRATGHEVQISFPRKILAKFDKKNKALITLRKTLIFIVSQIGNASYKGNLKKEQIIFSTREIVELGISKSPKKAPVVIQNALETLQQILFCGTSKFRGKKITIEKEKPVAMIESFKYRNGIFTVQLNPLIDWDFFFQGYYILPKAYYSLNGRACDLLNYIFFIARQRLERIKRKNDFTFTISYESLQFCLNLPDIEKAGEHRHIQRYCVKPINEAIDEIDRAIEKGLKTVSPELQNEDFLFIDFPSDRETQQGYKPKKPQELPNIKLEVTLGKAFSEYCLR